MEQTISIEKILKELYHISGFRISVFDLPDFPVSANRDSRVLSGKQQFPENKYRKH